MLTRRLFLTSTSAAALTACGPRGTFTAPIAGVDVTPVEIITASNRVTLESTERGTQLRFTKLTIGVTTDRKPGDVPVRGDQVFPLLDQNPIGSMASLRNAIGPVGSSPLIVFVHGFNNNAAEAVHRHAQFAKDAGLDGPQLSFLWPSSETPSGYLYDRDSALQSRQHLEEFFEMLPSLWSGEIVVIAHSLGCLLTMETLVRMRLKGDPTVFDGLVLLHPDISPDVFAAQVRDLGPLPSTAIIAINQADPALRVSALFSRAQERVGMTNDPQDYRAMGFEVIDLTEQSDALNPHLAALTSPTVLNSVRALATP